MKPLRWGILGTGNIAKQFAVGLLGAANSELVAVGSRTDESAKAFAALYPCGGVHGTYEELLANPAVEAVYVSLPNSMHYQWTIKALAAGKHVLCEKPFATNVMQATEMLDTAERLGLVLTEAFMYRSHPLTHEIQKTVDSGAIGELRVIRASFLYSAAKVQGSIKFDTSLAGGALMDIGCYCLSYARLFAKCEPVEMSAVGKIHPSGVDEYSVGTLRFPTGVLATFACGMTVRADNTTSLLGTEGYVEVPVPWKPGVEGAMFAVVNAAGERREVRVDAGKPLYALEADDFALAVRKGIAPRLSRDEILGNQRCLGVLRKAIGLPY